MKKVILTGSIAIAIAVNFSGCAYKTECGVDGCGKTYTDTTYRTYNPTKPYYPKNVRFSNDRSKSFVTPIPKQTSACCTKEQNLCTKSPVIPQCDISKVKLPKNTPVLNYNRPLKISVVGQGVAPTNTTSPAQAYALAKRAAIADAYRLIAEKVKGVYVEGDDYIKNMMVKRSTIKTLVQATIRNANVVEATFKEGLCEVEMEITLRRSQLL